MSDYDSLSGVCLADYKTLTGFEDWLDITEKLPADFLSSIKSSPNPSVEQLLVAIRKALFTLYAGGEREAKSFEESRFASLAKILEHKISSCGAITNVVGTALREFGIPTQFVHGILTTQHDSNRHAWLNIYNPRSGRWEQKDATSKDFSMRPDAKEIKTYRNWDELKQDYEKGEW